MKSSLRTLNHDGVHGGFVRHPDDRQEGADHIQGVDGPITAEVPGFPELGVVDLTLDGKAEPAITAALGLISEEV